MHTPAYCLEDFLHACNDDSRILVFRQAQQDSGEIFGLYTKQALLAFIANEGLEHMQYRMMEQQVNRLVMHIKGDV